MYKIAREIASYEDALKAYEEAIRLDSNYATAWYNKSNTLKALGREKEAQQCYEKACQLGYQNQSTTKPQTQVSALKAKVP